MKLSVTKRLLSWYDADIRELPWKATRDPYKIWLSEIILQQTRVQQGTPYYLRFVDRFPNVTSLASAQLDEILKLWEGLGYYSRARNLHAAAKQVVDDHNGEFPSNYTSLLELKGVGEYTAAAIASFAYDEPVAVVDGNVFRFLSRLFGEGLPIDSAAGKKRFKELATSILNKEKVAAHNQAIMDFGALVCLPRNPKCDECPFETDCVAKNDGRIELLPFKAKRIRKRERDFHYYIITDGRRVVIDQRSEKDIWNGLYQFPLLETDAIKEQQKAALQPADRLIRDVMKNAISKVTYPGYKQVLSHQNINARFTVMRMKDLSLIKRGVGWRIIHKEDLFKFAYPRIIHTFLGEMAEPLLDFDML